MDYDILIEQLTPEEGNIIIEQSGDTAHKNVYLSGIFMQGGIKNRNGRNYPVTEISREVDRATSIIKENNGIFGELDHPTSLTINLERVSHAVTDLRMDGSNAVGRARLLETPMGKIGKELINSQVRMGVSSRGAGSVADDGNVSGFNFVTVDIVATPSAPGAMPESVFESLQRAQNGQEILSLAESVRYDEAAQKYFKREITKWLNNNLFAKR